MVTTLRTIFAILVLTLASQAMSQNTRFELHNKSKQRITVTIQEPKTINRDDHDGHQSMRGYRLLADRQTIEPHKQSGSIFTMDLQDLAIPLHLKIELLDSGKTYHYMITAQYIPALVSLDWKGKALNARKATGNISDKLITKVKK